MKYFKTQDPILQQLRLCYSRSKNQAKHRGQLWQLSFDDFVNMWKLDDRYLQRGRGSNNYHMCRIDDVQGWTKSNVQIIRRGEHLKQRMLKHYDR